LLEALIAAAELLPVLLRLTRHELSVLSRLPLSLLAAHVILLLVLLIVGDE
jgi:hypothetical protein